MPRINLLPWREELRQKRQKDFMMALLGAVLVGGLLAYAYKLTVHSWTAAQDSRNTILRTEIEELDRQINEILGLENQKERLLARMEIIDQLQRSRPEVVHLFDELVNTMPDGVYLTQVKQTDARIEISGGAQSSTRVSAFMRNIDDSDWLHDTRLDVINTEGQGPTRNARFTIFAQQISITEQLEGELQ